MLIYLAQLTLAPESDFVMFENKECYEGQE